MPTPSVSRDDVTEILPIVALPSPHTTCPPEEDREYYAPREQREPEAVDPASPEEAAPSSTANAEIGATERLDELHESTSKRLDDDDEAVMQDAGSPSSAGEEYKNLAQSMSTAALSPSFPLSHPSLSGSNDSRFLPSTTSSFLRPGSKFRGTQQSDRQVYDVQVEIKHVDMRESFVCGYLRIQGLTDDHPTLTTYFEGEIIGNKHTFKTAHPEWGSSEKVDMQHWARFPAWRPLAKQAKAPAFTYNNYGQREHLFMRWKEYFLVPDHKVKTITGASFEGFYYICFNQCTGTVSGIYFHAKSEKYQQLELEHVRDSGCMGAMEFR